MAPLLGMTATHTKSRLPLIFKYQKYLCVKYNKIQVHLSHYLVFIYPFWYFNLLPIDILSLKIINFLRFQKFLRLTFQAFKDVYMSLPVSTTVFTTASTSLIWKLQTESSSNVLLTVCRMFWTKQASGTSITTHPRGGSRIFIWGGGGANDYTGMYIFLHYLWKCDPTLRDIGYRLGDVHTFFLMVRVLAIFLFHYD